MRNGEKPLRSNPESRPGPANGLAVNWLRDHLSANRPEGSVNGKLPRWGRTQPDGSRLKLFLDPTSSSLEVGHYSWPPGRYIVTGCNRENLDRYAFAASVVHEFLPDWYRSGNLIYANEQTRPDEISSSQNYGIFRDHRYIFENFSPIPNLGYGRAPEIEDFIDRSRSKNYALGELAKNSQPPLKVASGERLISPDQTPETPRLTDWLRPIMHEHHGRRLPARIRIGYYGPVDGNYNEVNAQTDYDQEKSRSEIAAQIMAEFMPGWEVSGACLTPQGLGPERVKMEEDGYRVCRWLIRDYLTRIEKPTQDGDSNPVPRYWANLMLFEMRDRALFGGNGRSYSLPHDLLVDDPVSVWCRNYPDGSQLRIVYEPRHPSQNGNKFQHIYNKDNRGDPLSRERLDVHDKIAAELVSSGVVPPPPSGQALPILKARPAPEAKRQRSAFFWV